MAANMAAIKHKMHISAPRQDTATNEVSNLIVSRPRIPFFAAPIVCECYFPRWRPIWPLKQMNANMATITHKMHISALRQATVKNEASNLIILRSVNRFFKVAIVWGCYYPRWRTRWPPKHKNLYISDQNKLQ